MDALILRERAYEPDKIREEDEEAANIAC